MKLASKKSVEMSFGMIFSIIAGAVIIFIAIYATARFVQTSQYELSSESAKSLVNMLSPVVNSISTAYAPAPIKFKKETRVYTFCETYTSLSPIFGRQVIGFSEQSGFLKKWPNPSANITRYNKYIFAEDVLQGKTVYIFSKPFYLGYKVDDLIYMSTNNYCFVAAPDFAKEELTDLNLKNVNFTNRVDFCKEDTLKVCFDFPSNKCNVSVYPEGLGESYEKGRVVRKNADTVKYAGSSLMYAAIFSSPKIYECNIKRLGMKANELGMIYNEKIDIVEMKECNSIIKPYISEILAISRNLSSSKLSAVYDEARLMDEQNCEAECEIYAPGAEACF
jgi:hypothetical protein